MLVLAVLVLLALVELQHFFDCCLDFLLAAQVSQLSLSCVLPNPISPHFSLLSTLDHVKKLFEAPEFHVLVVSHCICLLQ